MKLAALQGCPSFSFVGAASDEGFPWCVGASDWENRAGQKGRRWIQRAEERRPASPSGTCLCGLDSKPGPQHDGQHGPPLPRVGTQEPRTWLVMPLLTVDGRLALPLFWEDLHTLAKVAS